MNGVTKAVAKAMRSPGKRVGKKSAPERRLTDPIYARIWDVLGLGGPPPVVSTADLRAYNAAGIQPNGNRDVFISPEVARGIQSLPFSVGRNEDALKVLIHEYAHVRQPDMQKRANIEGGAEAYAQQHLLAVLQKLGVLPSGDVLPTENFAPSTRYPSPVYSPLVHRLLTKPGGRAIIDNLQFGMSPNARQ